MSVRAQVFASLLDRIDRLIGDRGPLPDGRQPPMWNGKLFDAIAPLAFCVPLFGVALSWIFVGDAGEVGAAFRLQPNAEISARIGLLVGLALFVGLMFSGWRAIFASALLAVAVVGLGSLVLLFVVLQNGSVIWALTFAVAFCAALLLAAAGSRAAGLLFSRAIIVGVLFALVLAFPDQRIAAGAVAFAMAWALVVFVVFVGRSRRPAQFWALFYPAALIASAFVPNLSAFSGAEPRELILASYLGVIGLVNVPFDFFSIGLTRALLRWGLDAKAPPPGLIALIDFALSLVILAGLACATILALHVVNFGVALAGGAPPLPIEGIIADLRRNPADPAHAWIYFTLFSTLAPSLLNIAIGLGALVALPLGHTSLLGQVRRVEGGGYSGNIGLVSIGLTAPWIFGLVLAFGGFLGVGWLMLHVTPLGPALLDAAEAFAALSAPWMLGLVDLADRLVPG